jgi:hypothetical protein
MFLHRFIVIQNSKKIVAILVKRVILHCMAVRTVGAMQPYFFPYLGYFQLIDAVDIFVVLDDVNFIKRGWIHRNRILIGNEPKYINIEVSHSSQNKKICDLNVNSDRHFVDRILKTIKQNYKNTPHFNQVFPLIQEALHCKESALSEYLKHSLRKVCEYLDIHTDFIVSSRINTGKATGQERIIQTVKMNEGTRYINPIGGAELYSHKDFELQGIKLEFLQMREDIPYMNPFLSIIDLLMNCEKSRLREFLKQRNISEAIK